MIALFAFWAAAYMNDPPLKSVELGSAAHRGKLACWPGRDMASLLVPGILLQGNLRRLGLYGFAGTSSITGYSTSDGVKANLRDRTLGFGIQYRILRMGKTFRDQRIRGQSCLFQESRAHAELLSIRIKR